MIALGATCEPSRDDSGVSSDTVNNVGREGRPFILMRVHNAYFRYFVKSAAISLLFRLDEPLQLRRPQSAHCLHRILPAFFFFCCPSLLFDFAPGRHRRAWARS